MSRFGTASGVAAARAPGFVTLVLSTQLTGEARGSAAVFLALALASPATCAAGAARSACPPPGPIPTNGSDYALKALPSAVDGVRNDCS